MSTTMTSTDPRSGDVTETGIRPSTPGDVDRVVEAAADAFAALRDAGRSGRAAMLRAVAEELEADRDELVAVGIRETALPRQRLETELTRTTHQARLFAEVVEDGGYLEASIDHAGQTPIGPGPDVRSMMVPLGPVAVFGASNFPLAFSVPGGDTVSALAAGCPVVVKAHDSHLLLSSRAHAAMQRAVARVGLPADVLGVVYGFESGTVLVSHPAITAVGFTGSLAGGEALMRVIGEREEPIPFFGELSSMNPVVVSPAAASARTEEIASGLVGSVTGSGGQLCTKPGLIFVPDSPAGDALVASVARTVAESPAEPLLNAGIAASYREGAQALAEQGLATVVATSGQAVAGEWAGVPTVLQTSADPQRLRALEECFGPLAVIVRYDDDELLPALASLSGSLTVSLHVESTDPLVTMVQPWAEQRAGRLVFNGWPTGVRVSWAQQHGGPWPSTNTQNTSVGARAIRRFVRPLAWQDAPVSALPEELRDGASVPQRVDGSLVLPEAD